MLLHELRDAIAGCPIPEDEVVAPEDVLERPQACYRVILDAGERSMVESDMTPRPSTGLRWKLIGAAS
jgi:hypothetical protein